MSRGIEGECKTPLSAGRLEAKFLHVRVAGTLECVDVRPAKLGAELFKSWEGPHDRRLDVPVEGLELKLEFLVEFDAPSYDSMLG